MCLILYKKKKCNSSNKREITPNDCNFSILQTPEPELMSLRLKEEVQKKKKKRNKI